MRQRAYPTSGRAVEYRPAGQCIMPMADSCQSLRLMIEIHQIDRLIAAGNKNAAMIRLNRAMQMGVLSGI